MQFNFSDRDSIGLILRELKDYFQNNYQAVSLHSSEYNKSFEKFLTEDRRGHCEFFATAAVILLRNLGIPSRIAAGYRGGNYNEIADIVIIRESDAHAWVELLYQDKDGELLIPHLL